MYTWISEALAIDPESPSVDLSSGECASETLMWRPREQLIAPAAGASSRRLQYPSKNSVDFWCFSRTLGPGAICAAAGRGGA